MKKFVQKLFGGSKEKQQSSSSSRSQTKSTTTQRKQQISYDYGELCDRVFALQEKGKYKSALEHLLPLLESNPQDEDVSLLASSIIHMSQSPGDSVYDAIEPLTSEHLGDRRLDHLFCQCNLCGNAWIPFPIPGTTVWNASGGQCPKCSRVFCQACSTVPGNSNYICPECSTILIGVEKPNGRKSRQIERRKAKLKLVMLFREGPVPPDDEYITEWLRRVSPEVFDDNPKIEAVPVFPWPKSDREMQRRAALLCTGFCNSLNLSTPDTIDGYFIEPGDDEGNHLYVVKVYDESQVSISHKTMANDSKEAGFTNAQEAQLRSKLHDLAMNFLADGSHYINVSQMSYCPSEMRDEGRAQGKILQEAGYLLSEFLKREPILKHDQLIGFVNECRVEMAELAESFNSPASNGNTLTKMEMKGRIEGFERVIGQLNKLINEYGELCSDNPEPWEAFKQKVSIPKEASDSDVGNWIRFVFVFDSEAHVNWAFSKLPEHIVSELADNKVSYYRNPDMGGKCLITFDPVTLTFRQAKDVMNLVVLQGGEIYEALIIS